MILKSLGIQMDLVDISGGMFYRLVLDSYLIFDNFSSRDGGSQGHYEGECQEEGGSEARSPSSDIQWREILWGETVSAIIVFVNGFKRNSLPCRITMISMLPMKMMN